jgi:hypothetical protein
MSPYEIEQLERDLENLPVDTAASSRLHQVPRRASLVVKEFREGLGALKSLGFTEGTLEERIKFLAAVCNPKS